MKTINEVIELANENFYKKDVDSLKNIISFFYENNIPFNEEKEGFNLLSFLLKEEDNYNFYLPDSLLEKRSKNFIDYFAYLKNENISLNTNVRVFDSETLYCFYRYGSAFCMEKNQPSGKIHLIRAILDSFQNRTPEEIIPVLEYITENFKGKPFLDISINMPDGSDKAFLSKCINNEKCSSLLIKIMDLNPFVFWYGLTNFEYSGTKLKYKFLENQVNKSCHIQNILRDFMASYSFQSISKNITLGEAYNKWLYKRDIEDENLFSYKDIVEAMYKLKKNNSFYEEYRQAYEELNSFFKANREKNYLNRKIINVDNQKNMKRL